MMTHPYIIHSAFVGLVLFAFGGCGDSSGRIGGSGAESEYTDQGTSGGTNEGFTDGGNTSGSSPTGSGTNGSGSTGGGEACEVLTNVVPLYTASEAESVVDVRADGVIITRGAGRVRGRHELEGTFSLYGERYFENRSYGFTIEDHVANGDSRIIITYRPEANVSTYGPGTNLRVWKIYGDGNVFYDNRGFDNHVNLQHLEATLEDNRREGRPLEVGDIMEFEFGIFIAGFDPADPGAIEGRTSYYTDTFRYQVGVGGLTATNTDTSGTLGPPVDFMPGGLTTIPYIYSEPELYFSQMALNTQPERVQSFLRGRRLFHTDFETGAHSESGNPPFDAHADQLGPLFNVPACSSCHQGNGRNVVEPMGAPLLTTVVKLYNGGDLGRQLQPQEAEVSRVEYGTTMVDMGDGGLELQQPTYEGLDMSTQPSIRMARRLIGLGLLEAVAEETILERAVAPGCDSDVAISGLASVVTDPETGQPRLGRFGWKAEKVDLRHQIADALDQDMGITTRIFGEPPEELSDDELLDLQTYMRLIAVPPRRAPEDPEVRHGKEVFDMIGCVACHHPSMETSDTHPFA